MNPASICALLFVLPFALATIFDALLGFDVHLTPRVKGDSGDGA